MSKPTPQPRSPSPEANVANHAGSVPRFQILRAPQTPSSPSQSAQGPAIVGLQTTPPRSTTPPQSVLSSEATSEGDVEEALLDTFLLQALNHPRDRVTLLKLDYELERFINSNRQRLDFPPMSSYQRMIVHRVAQYFKLQHTSVESEDSHKRVVVLFKGLESRVPDLRFADLLEQPETATKSIKIMRRPSDAQRGELQRRQDAAKTKSIAGPNKLNGAQITENEQKTIEEREEAYAKARARIFSQDLNGKHKEPEAKEQDKASDRVEKEKDDEKEKLPEKVQPVKAKERRTTYPQVPFETTSPDAFARRNYEEGWDSRFSAWPGAVDPTWHGGPLPDPTYWDASGPAYDPGADYYPEYYDPTLPPRPEYHPTQSRSSWPEPLAQPPRYLYAPENGTFVRATPTTAGTLVHPTPQQTSPYVPHGGIHAGNYVRHNISSNYGNESFVNNEGLPGPEGEMSRGMGEELVNGGAIQQPWGTNYDVSSTYSPKHLRAPVKVTSPVLTTGRQPPHTATFPQHTQPTSHQPPQQGRQTYPQPKTSPTQKPHQPQQPKQRYNPVQQQPPYSPYYHTQKRGTSPPHVVDAQQPSVKPPSNHPQTGTVGSGVYMPSPQYGYYMDQPPMPNPSGLPPQWPYYATGPISHPTGVPMGSVPYSAQLPHPTGEMMPQGVIDHQYGIQATAYQPNYYHQHRYSAIAGRSNYIGEYERPPPKSKELFDPSSPAPARLQNTSPYQPQQQWTNNTSPPPQAYGASTHYSQEQQVPTVYSVTSQQNPGYVVAPESNPASSDSQQKPQAFNPASLLVPNKGIKSVKPGATLIYDYSPKSLVEATPSPPAQACPPMVVHHILEVYELLKSSSESSTNSTEQQLPEAPTGRKGYLSKSKELTDEQEMYLEALKDAGATIKVLSSSGSILAIFKTASAAKQALESIQSPYFKLRRWTTPAATPPVSAAPEQMGQTTREAEGGAPGVAEIASDEKAECNT